MIELNLNNVEELVFFEKEFADFIPDFRQYYDQWRLSRMTPALRPIGNKSLIDFLCNITELQKEKIEEKFGEKIIIDAPNTKIIKFFETNCDSLEELLNKINVHGYHRFYRKGNKIFITIWR